MMADRRELSLCRDTFDRTDIPFCRQFVVAAGVRLIGVGRAIPIAIVCYRSDASTALSRRFL
jgi:hypothetical protein